MRGFSSEKTCLLSIRRQSELLLREHAQQPPGDECYRALANHVFATRILLVPGRAGSPSYEPKDFIRLFRFSRMWYLHP